MYKVAKDSDGVLETDKETGEQMFYMKDFYFVYDTEKKCIVDKERFMFDTPEEAQETVNLFNQFKIVKAC